MHLSAAQHITLASGQDSQWAAGGTYRLHTGQAIGVLAPDGHFKFPHLWPPQIPPGKTAGL